MNTDKTPIYRVLKTIVNKSFTEVNNTPTSKLELTQVWVNDKEGEPIEYDTMGQATKIAELFETNSTHGCKYQAIKI